MWIHDHEEALRIINEDLLAIQKVSLEVNMASNSFDVAQRQRKDSLASMKHVAAGEEILSHDLRLIAGSLEQRM